MKFLNVNDMIEIHESLIAVYGGLNGVRNENLIYSSIEQIYQTFAGEDLYPSLEEKTARLGYSIIRNHPFLDGNKRTGLALMLHTLLINNIELDEDYINESLLFIQSLASGEKTYEEVLEWIKKVIK
ncbi:MAG: type II toxin-antitoxin system death-on-curing family toxin [Fusobacterium gastrosuis]|uniref:type II toxin-antitoxin system death-on-curing family toxin n=1 Tax=Fusobacterium gastrosuis TaxID=1755100 RepID=UPI0029763F80|nr:type II toxin-antitoxin system death-on-curing family toxin [Fusobacteriaceae bacterium]MDD7410590.1 type II toxin-antitoxin system death-on-curing family toxin [Fusobacteriaceae bacterium]MDY4011515.1 type II toxin-antitoxin system death-on-curing family toxin [Fusobacterium gastrosuis]MDY5714178.1 type II toxin-antitoxin system death-on-curing family toxin [Fusobacterium gastrosuis]